MNMSMDIDEETSSSSSSFFFPQHQSHEAQHSRRPHQPSKLLFTTSPLTYTSSPSLSPTSSYSSGEDDDTDTDDDWIPETPLLSFSPRLLPFPDGQHGRSRSDSVPSLCHSVSTASSPDEDGLRDVDVDDVDFDDFSDSSKHPSSEDEDEIMPYPPSFTPPTFYSPLSFASTSSSSKSTEDELSGLMCLQRRTKEELAKLDDLVQLHSSASTPSTVDGSGGAGVMLGGLKSKRKSVKERCKEVDGLVKFGLDKLDQDNRHEDDDTDAGFRHREEPQMLTEARHHRQRQGQDSPIPIPLTDQDPRPTRQRTHPQPPPLSLLPPSPTPTPASSLSSSSAGSLLFPTLPSPTKLSNKKKKKKEPPSSIHHLVSRMILQRRAKESVRSLGSGSVGRDGARRKSGLAREVALTDDDEAGMVVDEDEGDEDVSPFLRGGSGGENDDANEMDEDDLDDLGLTGFD
ncbi:hypothetical protein DL96DRAFT_1713028 [Flagelloscypha sp. PMI_526]|nr:hypothetical protein DL96DRAFT_1713028 [Flagelloscypha sp. PMI_526]